MEAGIVEQPEHYLYSSAKDYFYEKSVVCWILPLYSNLLKESDSSSWATSSGEQGGVKKELLCKEFDFWIEKLRADSSDLAANLVLYYIYRRDTAIIKALELNKNKWSEIKEKEIQYWKYFFEQKTREKGCI